MGTLPLRPSVDEPAASGAHARSRGGVAAAVVLVALVLGLLVVHDIGTARPAIASLPCFGPVFAAETNPPPLASHCGHTGYDGQFFWLQAHDPLLLHDSTIRAMRASRELFRIQRLGYPLAAFLLAGGRPSALPDALLAVNLLTLLVLGGWLAAWCVRHGRSPLWGAVVALMPGMLVPVMHDLSDAMAAAGALVGVLAWQERRTRAAAIALTIAVLTREVTIVLVLGLLAEAGLRAWRQRRGDGPAVVRDAIGALGVPAALFAIWEVYVRIRAGGSLGDADSSVPFLNLVREASLAVRTEAPVVAGWELLYLALLAVAVGIAAWRLRRSISISSVALCALCASVVLPAIGDLWGSARLGAPLLGLILLDGLRRRDRTCVAVGSIAAALSLFLVVAG